MIAFAGYSQKNSGTDSCICISEKQAVNILRSKDSLQVAKSIILIQDSVILSQKNINNSLASEFSESLRLVGSKDALISNLDEQIKGLNKINQLTLDYTVYLKKRIKKANKKIIIISGISVSVISGLAYLLTQ